MVLVWKGCGNRCSGSDCVSGFLKHWCRKINGRQMDRGVYVIYTCMVCSEGKVGGQVSVVYIEVRCKIVCWEFGWIQFGEKDLEGECL
jgi:hypothetical protein